MPNMDGLDEFEKQLEAEKRARERARSHSSGPARDHRKHTHHHRSKHRKHDEEDEHRRKRSRRSKDGDEGDQHAARQKYMKTTDPHEDLPLPDDEETQQERSVRDAWMTDPSALQYEYTQRGIKKERKAPSPKPDYNIIIHKNELNHQLKTVSGRPDNEPGSELTTELSYKFGDAGSRWRMTKLKAVYTKAERDGLPVENIAIEQFGDLEHFDAAREEEIELERRRVYGDGYVGKEQPSGELYKERRLEVGIQSRPSENESQHFPGEPPQGIVEEDEKPTITMDQSQLNRLKAQLLKAKLKNPSDVSRLEAEYDSAMKIFTEQSATGVVVLGKMENRLLAGSRGEVKAIDNKRGRERGSVQDNEDMSIEDMVREERRTRGQMGGDGMRAAERIAKDAKYDNDLDYMDENATKLAKRVHKSELNLKNAAIGEYQKMNKILDSCMLCAKEDTNQPPIAPMLSLATRVYLTLPTEPELSEGGAVIVPIQHRVNLLECDDDEWEEIRNFMKCLTRMYHDQGRDVLFYENAAAPHRKMHAAMQVVPLPYSLGETAPAFFREAILSADEEWSQHKKLIDTASKAKQGLGKLAFRRSLAKEMPYFHVWFDLEGGLGHIVEDAARWPKGDLFAREIIGGMLDVEPDVIKRQGRWNRADKRVEGFRKRWKKFDWTRVLTDG